VRKDGDFNAAMASAAKKIEAVMKFLIYLI